MKLPSLQQILADARHSAARFPMVLFTAALGTFAAVALIEAEDIRAVAWLINVLYAALLGAPLFTAVALTAEKERWSRMRSLITHGAVAVLLAAYGWSLPGDLSAGPGVHGARLALLAVAAHLLVAVGPYLRGGEQNGFWQYNRVMFLRILTAGVFTGVLYAGLAIALAALENLFGIHIRAERYAQLGVLLLGLFNTWYFLAGLPRDLAALETDTTYPAVLKVFAQYIVFPLALIYLVILYAYVGKLLVEWEWPRGWVSKLILGFAGTGTFTMLLLHPIRDSIGNAWMRSAARWFHILLAPLVVLLFFALARRSGEYGLTEGRYLAYALGVWCAAMIVYFLSGRARSLKAIPLSLCILAVVVSYGPWSAFSVSERGQVARLEQILQRNGILKDGVVHKAASTVSFTDAREISALLSYLRDMYGYEGIRQWFAEDLRDTSPERGSSFKDPKYVAGLLGVEYVHGWARADDENISYETGEQPLTITGYDRLLVQQYLSREMRSKTFDEAGLQLNTSEDLSLLDVVRLEGDRRIDSVRFDMRALARRVHATFEHRDVESIPCDSMTLTARSAGMDVKLITRGMVLQKKDGVLVPLQFRVQVMYRQMMQ